MTEPAEAPRHQEPLPSHVTTPLLTLITQQSLDQDYRMIAERRANGDLPREPTRLRMLAGVVLAIFGILISLAAVQTSRQSDITDAGRAALIAQINERKADLEHAQSEVAELQRGNLRLEQRLEQLRTSSRAEAALAGRLETETGFGVAHGPGVRIVVRSADDAGDRRMVRDEDLAKLVDGLWQAGAEAIAVNGQRLTALGAIRNVGSAIHVNGRGLRPPYTVEAIGNRDTLGADLLATTHGSEFFSLADQLGFQYSVEAADNLVLPASPLRRLRSVQQGTGDEHPGHEAQDRSHDQEGSTQ